MLREGLEVSAAVADGVQADHRRTRAPAPHGQPRSGGLDECW
jgi:hypothetical protein